MYEVKGNQIYFYHPINGTTELFITVHQTKDCAKTPEEQAVIIARALNSMPLTRN